MGTTQHENRGGRNEDRDRGRSDRRSARQDDRRRTRRRGEHAMISRPLSHPLFGGGHRVSVISFREFFKFVIPVCS
jgi:hypothetical protein